MHIQNLVKFYPFVLKILSGNEMMMDRMTEGMTDGMTERMTDRMMDNPNQV